MSSFATEGSRLIRRVDVILPDYRLRVSHRYVAIKCCDSSLCAGISRQDLRSNLFDMGNPTFPSLVGSFEILVSRSCHFFKRPSRPGLSDAHCVAVYGMHKRPVRAPRGDYCNNCLMIPWSLTDGSITVGASGTGRSERPSQHARARCRRIFDRRGYAAQRSAYAITVRHGHESAS